MIGDYVCDQLKLVSGKLEAGITGVSFHRFEITSLGMKLTLGRLTGDNEVAQLTRIIGWTDLEFVRPMGVPGHLESVVNNMVAELLNNDLHKMREALFPA